MLGGARFGGSVARSTPRGEEFKKKATKKLRIISGAATMKALTTSLIFVRGTRHTMLGENRRKSYRERWGKGTIGGRVGCHVKKKIACGEKKESLVGGSRSGQALRARKKGHDGLRNWGEGRRSRTAP